MNAVAQMTDIKGNPGHLSKAELQKRIDTEALLQSPNNPFTFSSTDEPLEHYGLQKFLEFSDTYELPAKTIERDLVMKYCYIFQEWRKLNDFWKAGNAKYHTAASGYPSKHPLLTHWEFLFDRLNKSGVELQNILTLKTFSNGDGNGHSSNPLENEL